MIDACRYCGHQEVDHGDRAVAACAPTVRRVGDHHSTGIAATTAMKCGCLGWMSPGAHDGRRAA